jgi:hypothetical protein
MAHLSGGSTKAPEEMGAWFKAGLDQDGFRLGGIWHQEHRSGNPVGNCGFIEDGLDMLNAAVVSLEVPP